ncbi:hypothetical protein QBC40DRAFT_290519 [Triangularia verruculosa]|uniref:Uncharacterized protein n=1 Tax=Triangularia verruculosa TaxID=2587418 RepID=A0AAN7AR37_9PEZI|nr:hypothetical protein QBC40DRAFT_290519 [Triangularia verruculosa]
MMAGGKGRYIPGSQTVPRFLKGRSRPPCSFQVSVLVFVLVPGPFLPTLLQTLAGIKQFLLAHPAQPWFYLCLVGTLSYLVIPTP